MLQIIKRDQSLDKNEKNLGHAERVILAAGNLVQLLDGIVRNIAEGAAEKGRNSRHRDGPASLQ